MGQTCCNPHEGDREKMTLDLVNSKTKSPQKPAQERETSYVEGNEDLNDLDIPNHHDQIELLVMGTPTSRSKPRHQDYKESGHSQPVVMPTTMTSSRFKIDPIAAQQTKDTISPPIKTMKPMLQLESPRVESSLGEGRSGAGPSSQYYQTPSMALSLGNSPVTQATFKVEKYEREEFREYLPLDDNLLRDTAEGVKNLLNTQGNFAFHLLEYDGKELPVNRVEFDEGAVVYFGQGFRNSSGRFVKQGKGHLITKMSLFSGYFTADDVFGPGVFIVEQDATASYLFGFWTKDLLHGEGLLIYDTGYRYLGEFVDGLQHGKGSENWPDESSYQGEYRAGLKYGYGECDWPGKAKYVGEFKNGMFNGHGAFYWANGNSYTGSWRDNQIEGYGNFTWADGITYEGNYKLGKREGQGRITWPRQMIWEGQWRQGKRILSCGRYINLEGDCIPRNKSPQLRAFDFSKDPD
jgi:hypothetical protein